MRLALPERRALKTIRVRRTADSPQVTEIEERFDMFQEHIVIID
jgi:hypothetical protein